ncbi:hypothetical protein TNCV_3343351 [Trichonephila clavipes]|nr:hypothetical protein TNCV_3343351 [Trichonephila clavipes]
MVLRFDVNSAARWIKIVSTAFPYRPERRQFVYLQFSLDLISLDLQEGLLVYSRVLVILDGRRPCQDYSLGQDIVTGDEVPQHQCRFNRSYGDSTADKVPLVKKVVL